MSAKLIPLKCNPSFYSSLPSPSFASQFFCPPTEFTCKHTCFVLHFIPLVLFSSPSTFGYFPSALSHYSSLLTSPTILPPSIYFPPLSISLSPPLPLLKDGCTSFHYAANNAEILTQLLASHSTPRNINAPSSRGETPLHLACLNGNLESAKLLVSSGADLEVRDGKGNSVLHLSAASGSIQLIHWINGHFKNFLNSLNKVSHNYLISKYFGSTYIPLRNSFMHLPGVDIDCGTVFFS